MPPEEPTIESIDGEPFRAVPGHPGSGIDPDTLSVALAVAARNTPYDQPVTVRIQQSPLEPRLPDSVAESRGGVGERADELDAVGHRRGQDHPARPPGAAIAGHRQPDRRRHQHLARARHGAGRAHRRVRRPRTPGRGRLLRHRRRRRPAHARRRRPHVLLARLGRAGASGLRRRPDRGRPSSSPTWNRTSPPRRPRHSASWRRSARPRRSVRPPTTGAARPGSPTSTASPTSSGAPSSARARPSRSTTTSGSAPRRRASSRPASSTTASHVDDVGGGVSQFATTLFNAAFFAGLDFGEYQSHSSSTFSRYPYGREATMSLPAPRPPDRERHALRRADLADLHRHVAHRAPCTRTQYADGEHGGPDAERRRATAPRDHRRAPAPTPTARTDRDTVHATLPRPADGASC